MTKLIKRVSVVQEYLIIGEAQSSADAYWEKDFREERRIPVGKPETATVHPLRRMGDGELALLGARREDDD